MCIKWLNKRLKRLNIIDIALIKTTLICFGLLVGAYFSGIILQYWWLILAIMILAMLKPYYKALK